MDFDNMLGKPLKSVELAPDKEKISFLFEDGSKRVFGVEGECCSSSWIEHLEMPNTVEGAKISGVEDGGGAPYDDHVCPEPPEAYGSRSCGHDCLQVYQTVFHTNLGDIRLEYRNDSNGYYGGYLVDLT